HATASESNPYVVQEPTIGNNGDLSGGHLNHKGPIFPAPDWGDIIPPFTYVDQNGVTQTFPGYNWTPDGQAIWHNGCNPGLKPLTPTVDWVGIGRHGHLFAHFGYVNPNDVKVVAPFTNAFSPPPEDRGQPTEFEPGQVHDAVQATSSGEPITWSLAGNTATASSESKRCQGTITVVKILNPSSDQGRFNLEIGGETAGGASAVG